MTIAKEIELEDHFENMGAQLVKEVATKTNDVAGDGTTTATVLAQALVREGLRNVAAGANPIALKRGIEKAVAAAVESIRTLAKDVDDKAEIAQVASISAADPSIGEVISEAIDKVGKDGVVTVEESNTFGVELEFTEGMQFDKGYISPYFVTDQERQEAVLEDPFILIANQKISSAHDLIAVLERVMQAGKPLLHHRRGRRRRGPGHPDRQQAAGHVPERGRQGTWVRRPPQGHAGRHRHLDRRPGRLRRGRPQAGEHRHLACSAVPARSSLPRTRPRSSKVPGAEADVKGRIAQIKREIEDTDSDWDREKLQERLAKLAGGVAVIQVGAATEIELKEKKHRIEDAVSATKAAIEEGIVPGGGTGPAALPAPAVDKLAKDLDRRRGHRCHASSARPWTSRCAGSPPTPGLEGAVVVEQAERETGNVGPQRCHVASSRTCSRRASSTPPRSPVPPCKTRPLSPRYCSPPRRRWPTSPSQRAAPAGGGAGRAVWAAWG